MPTPVGQPGNQLATVHARHKGQLQDRTKALRSLAMFVREKVDMERLVDKLEQMSEGKDPATGEAIPVREQREAIKMLLERGYGMPAMHVAIEGHVRQEIAIRAPREARPKLSLDEINERRAQLRGIGVKPKMIDAESVEVETPADAGHEE